MVSNIQVYVLSHPTRWTTKTHNLISFLGTNAGGRRAQSTSQNLVRGMSPLRVRYWLPTHVYRVCFWKNRLCWFLVYRVLPALLWYRHGYVSCRLTGPCAPCGAFSHASFPFRLPSSYIMVSLQITVLQRCYHTLLPSSPSYLSICSEVLDLYGMRFSCYPLLASSILSYFTWQTPHGICTHVLCNSHRPMNTSKSIISVIVALDRIHQTRWIISQLRRMMKHPVLRSWYTRCTIRILSLKSIPSCSPCSTQGKHQAECQQSPGIRSQKMNWMFYSQRSR